MIFCIYLWFLLFLEVILVNPKIIFGGLGDFVRVDFLALNPNENAHGQ